MLVTSDVVHVVFEHCVDCIIIPILFLACYKMQKIEEKLPPDKMKMNGLHTRTLLMQLLEKVVLTRGEYLI
jgi:hypothetical protein